MFCASLGINASFPFYYSISYLLYLMCYESVQWVSSPNSNLPSFSFSFPPFLPSLFPFFLPSFLSFLVSSLPPFFLLFSSSSFLCIILCIKSLIAYLQSYFICIIFELSEKPNSSWILRCPGMLSGILPALPADRVMESAKESISGKILSILAKKIIRLHLFVLLSCILKSWVSTRQCFVSNWTTSYI